MRAIARHGLPTVIATTDSGITTIKQRGRPWTRWRIPALAFTTAVLLVIVPVAAFAATAPALALTLFDEETVVLRGEAFPGNSEVSLTANLTYDDGMAYSGSGVIHTSRSGGFLVGFALPEDRAVAAQITVTAAADGSAPLTASLPIGPMTSSPSPTTSSSPATPGPSSAAPGAADNDVSRCPASGAVTGAPSGNTFAGHTYDGHGQTLPKGNYSIDSNTCVQNYVFDGSNLTLKGVPSNVTIVNNTFQNWPAKQAIANVNGKNITINYNTIKNTAGGAYTGIFGQGSMTDVTVNHNDIQNLGAAVDGIQLRFTGTGTNVQVSYNRITDNGRFPIELQQVVHGLKVLHNYVTVRSMGGKWGGQISVATGNDKDGGGYYDSDTSGVEAAYNIILNTDAKVFGACLESRGNGNSLHDNYCRNFQFINDYAMTNNSQPNPWHVTDNILLGPGGGTFSTYEGFNRSGYQPVAPTESGNRRYSLNDPNAPPAPSWDYQAGAQ